MSQGDKGRSPLLVKAEEAKKGAAWKSIAEERSIKQHGGNTIPEGDIHALPKHQSPIQKHDSPEETEAAFKTLENEIKKLQEKDKQKLHPSTHGNSPEDWLKE